MTFRSMYAFLTKGMTIQQKAIVGFVSAVVVLVGVFVVVTGRYKEDYSDVSRTSLQHSRTAGSAQEFTSGLSDILSGIVTPAQYGEMVASLDKELTGAGVLKDEEFSCTFEDQGVSVTGKVRDFEITSAEYGTMTIADDTVKIRGVEESSSVLLSDMGVVSQETVYGFVVQMLAEYKDRLKTDCAF